MNKRKIMRSLKINELSAVDNPANVHARATIMKRRDVLAEQIAKYCEAEEGARSFAELLTEEENRKRYWEAYEAIYPLMDALSTSVRSIIADENLTPDARQSMIRQSAEDFLTAIREKAPEVEAEINKIFASGGPELKKEGPIMPKTIEQLEADIAELNKSVTGLNAQIVTLTGERDQAVTKVTALETENVDLKKSVDLAKGDETVTIEGEVIRKSEVGTAAFAGMKAAASAIEKANDRAETAEFEKVASAAYSHVVGTPAEIGAILKFAKGAPEAVGASIKTVLETAEKLAKAGFASLGHRQEDVRKAAGDFMAKVSEVQARDKCSKVVALEKAEREFPAEFEAYQAAGQEAAAQ